MNPLLSGSVLSAALMLGQASDPPSGGAPSVIPPSVPPPPSLTPTPAPAPGSQPAQRGPIISFFMREDRPVLSKITSWFKREQPETPPPAPMKGLLQREPMAPPTPTTPTPPASNDFPRRLPNPSSKATPPTPVVTVVQDVSVPPKKADAPAASAPQTGASNAAKNPVRAQFANKIGRDEKFDWITGQLEMENGVYVLYYATPETVDKYHGRIVLHPQEVSMRELHRGDLVSVRGQLVQRPATPGLGPVYRLSSASLIERPKI